MERVKNRLASWKSKWISWAGSLTILKAVIPAIATYMISCLPLAKVAFSELNQKIQNIFFGKVI